MNEKLKYWDDFLNPVLVKEVRQFFHNKLFLSLAAGLLGVQLMLLLGFDLSFSQWKDSSDAGKYFITVDTILMYLCVFGTAVWGAMQRFTQERSSRELDFTNITLLTPWQIVGGKLASSLVIWGLIAALCLPFMTVAYFFRNVTLADIFMIFGAGVMPTLILIQAALFCGALGKKWIYILFFYFGFQVIIPMALFSVAAFAELRSAVDIFWALQGGCAMLFILLLASTIALITPPYANRMLPLRVLLCIMLLPVLAVLPFSVEFKKELELVFAAFPMGLIGFLALLATCDRDIPGGRVLAQVPRSRAGRFLHYLFSSNRTGGMLLTLIVLLIFGAELLLMGIWKEKTLAIMSFGMAGYIAFYAEIAILLNRHVPSITGWAWLLIILCALGVVPLIAAANQDVELSEIIISPFSLMDHNSGEYVIWNFAFWIAPLAAWLLGGVFVTDMLGKYKDYKAPELLEGHSLKKDEVQ